jgi:CubicO group peptidase (beta-lactamase class C family)
MVDSAKSRKLDLHSLLVIRNGYIVNESYFGSYGQETKHELYSCTKSFVSTLLGIAIDKGYVDSVDRPVKDFFPNRTFANPSPSKDAMRLEHLLTMTSGLYWTEGDPTYAKMYMSSDWVGFVMDETMIQKPGTIFNYCSGCSHVLSAIVQAKTGMNTLDFARKELFEPLAISNYDWATDSRGLSIGGWGLQLAPRDMAKLGYLFLNKGVWDGKQIVSSSWVETATQKHTSTDGELEYGDLGYGYQWWTYPSLDAYTALGRYGQTIFVIPKLNLVIVTTAEVNDHTEIFKLIENYVVPAVGSE